MEQGTYSQPNISRSTADCMPGRLAFMGKQQINEEVGGAPRKPECPLRAGRLLGTLSIVDCLLNSLCSSCDRTDELLSNLSWKNQWIAAILASMSSYICTWQQTINPALHVGSATVIMASLSRATFNADFCLKQL